MMTPPFFNLNQVNTSECCNDDYVECNQHDISVMNDPKETMCFDTDTKRKTSKKNKRTHVPLSKELEQTQGLKNRLSKHKMCAE